MTRKAQFWVLIFLSAGTAFCQYIIQGTMAAGMSPTGFGAYFWTADQFLWGFRALIETWVVGYLFSTASKKWYQQIPLVFFEVALLVLIVFTLGPAFEALGAKTVIYELLSAGNYRSWAYAIAAYTSLMIAGAGTAYKIQPFDIKEDESVKPKRIPKPEPTKNGTSREEALPVVLEAIQSTEEGKINQAELAEQFGVSRQTMGNWLKFWQREMVIGPLDGRGKFRIVEKEMGIPEFGQ